MVLGIHVDYSPYSAILSPVKINRVLLSVSLVMRKWALAYNYRSTKWTKGRLTPSILASSKRKHVSGHWKIAKQICRINLEKTLDERWGNKAVMTKKEISTSTWQMGDVGDSLKEGWRGKDTHKWWVLSILNAELRHAESRLKWSKKLWAKRLPLVLPGSQSREIGGSTQNFDQSFGYTKFPRKMFLYPPSWLSCKTSSWNLGKMTSLTSFLPFLLTSASK